MTRRIHIISALFASAILVFYACSKDDDPTLDNPTNGKTTALFNPDVTYGTLTDREGNVYKTVTIGTQTWMAKDLRTTLYNDGTFIPEVTDASEWLLLTTGAYCNYNNTTSSDTIATYGRLYNWYTINTGKLAPEGWHVATDDEWTTLTTLVGNGGKLMETGTSHWISTNISITNESGFTALPGGTREMDGAFGYIGEGGTWWSATEANYLRAWYRSMYNNDSYLYRMNGSKIKGYSVRCVMD